MPLPVTTPPDRQIVEHDKSDQFALEPRPEDLLDPVLQQGFGVVINRAGRGAPRFESDESRDCT